MQEYEALLDAQMRVNQFKAARADHRQQGSMPKEFRVGELFIRKILLGSPNSSKLAKTPPSWIRQGSLLEMQSASLQSSASDSRLWIGERPVLVKCWQ